MFKVNLKGSEEFCHVLADLGFDKSQMDPVAQVFTTHYVHRMNSINAAYEEEDDALEQSNSKATKKFPLNLAAAENQLSVSNPRLVDVDWQLLHTLNSKNLNKVFQPQFRITLTLLTQQGGALQQGCSSLIEWSSKRNYLKLKKVRFECDQTELTHLLFKVKTATNSVEQLVKPKKE